ncbi:MAG TPA: PEP-CTERM sorting domain-containing protein [Candidatus Sulfotelmatobacter sp.]|nr:PEP-CTERM sorting domain-containing protein [Candidatus Sulfotelmatobacter sp.]
MMRSTLIAIGMALLAFCGGTARAELVLNGGFESNDGVSSFTSWTNSGDGILVDQTFPNSGTSDAAFTATGTLSQTLATTPGQDLTLSFALLDEAGDFFDTFNVSLGAFSTSINGLSAPGFYQTFTFTVLGTDITSPSTSLSFQGELDPTGTGGPWNLDDVSVTEAAAVPEPASLGIFGIGILGFAFLLRHRARFYS